MTDMSYRLVDDKAARLGLIVLRVDETIEADFRAYFPSDTARLFVTRVNAGDHLTPETIAAMETGLAGAAGLLPRRAFDVVGYGCTSGAALIGASAVAEAVAAGAETGAVTEPLSALLAALQALGLRRIAVVSPYIPSVAAPLAAALTARGVTVADTVSFGEKVEARVARIDPGSVMDAARGLVARTPVDAVFLSCTNLRVRDSLAPLEAELGVPVLSSNQVLAWHMARLAGVPVAASGRLFDHLGH